MKLADIGVDAARALKIPGPGLVRAVFARALYLQVPGGLVVLVTTREPRGPLHLRVAALPPVAPRCPVSVGAQSLRVGGYSYRLDAPVWSPRLPTSWSLTQAIQGAQNWLPDLGPTLDLGSTRPAGLPTDALAALRNDELLKFATTVSGRGPGLTPAGDDVLAGVLLVAHIIRDASDMNLDILGQCAHGAQTNDIARAFLICAARGRCIEPAHELLNALAGPDHGAVNAAVRELHRFGSSSGAALTYGIRAALLQLPTISDAPQLC